MKKFERLERNAREEEIQLAAIKLFNEKGFKAVTMQDIVDNVSLSKGGVYRIYPSTVEILNDLIIKGMRLRNEYYLDYLKEIDNFDMKSLVDMVIDSLFIYPDISSIYVEFLIEKSHNQKLEKLYQEIYLQSFIETKDLFNQNSADISLDVQEMLKALADVMNVLIIAIKLLDLRETIIQDKALISELVMTLLKNKSQKEK